MKKLLIIALLTGTFFFVSGQNTYYVSSTGNDTKDGLTQATAWKSLAKVNSMFGSFVAGDQILFKRGSTFYGALYIKKSGARNNPIILGAYGTGSKPVITGFKEITDWANLGGNIWESSSVTSTLKTCKMVEKDGVNLPVGRLPKKGYWITTGSTTSSITDSLNGHLNTTDWTGAELVARINRWSFNKTIIKSASGTTINFLGDIKFMYKPVGWGYFIQNDIKTLTEQNDWYYNPVKKKLDFYSAGNPGAVHFSTVDTLVYLNRRAFISFDNIAFTGANNNAIHMDSASHITIKNCEFHFIGSIAVFGNLSYKDVPHVTIQDCNATECNDEGFSIGYSDSAVIERNKLYNIGNIAGSGYFGYKGIECYGNNGLITANILKRCGYSGIFWAGDSTIVSKNFIDTTGYILDDGGGIYCNGRPGLRYKQRIVRDNIVLNAIGAIEGGVPSSNTNEAVCIYNDEDCSSIDYINNTMYNGYMGMFIHGGKDILVDSNTTYQCDIGLYIRRWKRKIENMSITHNAFISAMGGGVGVGKYSISYIFDDSTSKIPVSFKSNNNVYARPTDQKNGWIYYQFVGEHGSVSVTDWKTLSGRDSGSTGSPVEVKENNFRLEYNTSGKKKTITLPRKKTYIDVRGKSYSGKLTLTPYSSVVLIPKK